MTTEAANDSTCMMPSETHGQRDPLPPAEIAALAPLDARIPAWSLSALLERACPVCGSRDGPQMVRRPDGLHVRRCDHCSTYYVDPAPSEESLAAFYDEYDRRHRRAAPLERPSDALRLVPVDPLSDLRIRELSSLMQFRGSRVLDIGFGRAEFLLQARALGAIPEGVEVDPDAVSVARSLGIDVHLGDLTSLPAGRRFDLMTLLDVVEHPLCPLEMLEHASRRLADQGLLAIWTPNGDAGRDRNDHATFRVDLEHMQYFTAQTCEVVAERLGLHTVHLETLGFPVLGGIADEGGRRTRFDTVKSRLGRTSLYRRAWAWKDRLVKAVRLESDERRGTYHLFCIMRKG